MNKNSQKKNSIWMGRAIGFALLLLAPFSSNAVAQTNTFPSSGNVGIGTTSPVTKLQVNTGTDQNFTVQSHVALSTGVTIASINDAGSAGQPIEVRGSAVQLTGSGNLGLYVNSSGNVGIGTASPAAKLDISGSTFLQYMTLSDATSYGAISFRETGGSSKGHIGMTGSGSGASYVGGANAFQIWNGQNTPMVFGTNGTERVRIDSAGNVGIGTTTPGSGYKLDVTGNLNASGTITGGNIIAKYQDLAEWVPSSEQLPTGTVVVLDSTKSNQVTASSVSYDTRVAGVISEQPGIALGERGENKVLVATTGRVRVKVDATHAPIQVGDLLVASDIPGMAMKSEPVSIGGIQLHRPGTLIGKALEPLTKGQGTILVLLSLQ